MRTKPCSRPNPSGRSRSCKQLDRHILGYRQYLSDRGNAAGYVRNCEAAVAHLSMWLKNTNKRVADVGEELVAEFVDQPAARLLVVGIRSGGQDDDAYGHGCW